MRRRGWNVPVRRSNDATPPCTRRPIVWVGRERAENRLGLGEMPRNGRPYVERPLTVESLSEFRSILESAAGGWRDLVIALSIEFRS